MTRTSHAKEAAMQIGDMVDHFTLESIHDLGIQGAVVYLFTSPSYPGKKLSTRAMYPGHTDDDIAGRVRRTNAP
jgi:hypothetical protein